MPLPIQVVLIQPEGFTPARALIPTAEMFCYGLRRLGRIARIERNGFLRDGANIVVGAHLLDASVAPTLPAATVIFNTEPLGFRPQDLAALQPFAKRFPVWDYSPQNAAAITAAIPGARVRVVEPGYLPEFTRVRHSADKDVDALFFGHASEPRTALLNELSAAGLRVRQLNATYERELDAWLARTRLVLALQFDKGTPFALGRIVRALSNRCAVVVEHAPGDDIPPDLAAGLAIAPRGRFLATCRALLDDDALRDALATRGFECITRRDFTITLGAALAAEPIFSDVVPH